MTPVLVPNVGEETLRTCREAGNSTVADGSRRADHRAPFAVTSARAACDGSAQLFDRKSRGHDAMP